MRKYLLFIIIIISSCSKPINIPGDTNDVIYLGSGEKIYAIDAQTGTQRWVTESKNATFSSVSVEDDLLFTQTSQKCIALSTKTGEQKWEYSSRAIGSSGVPPLVQKNVVYTAAGFIFIATGITALDAKTGKEIWSYSIGQAAGSSTPIVVNGTLYVCMDRSLFAFNATTGEKKWQYVTTINELGTHTSPVVGNGVVYFGSGTKKVIALDAESGDKRWEFSIGNAEPGSPTLANGILYFGTDTKKIYALDAKTGLLKWQFETSGSVGTPTVANDLVYFSSIDRINNKDHRFYALNSQTGTIQWEFETNGEIGGCVVANGIVYFGSNDKKLYAFSALYGTKYWEFPTEDAVVNFPCVVSKSGKVFNFSSNRAQSF
ncbi:PQQ-binding-like beta-propeller repeat protein [Runella sp.]|uniref:outer membrane protein assembly factor BamB family protein n=1 Tax=Runella sp. TaxID=1960881 RepID=UPI003D0E3F1E